MTPFACVALPRIGPAVVHPASPGYYITRMHAPTVVVKNGHWAYVVRDHDAGLKIRVTDDLRKALRPSRNVLSVQRAPQLLYCEPFPDEQLAHRRAEQLRELSPSERLALFATFKASLQKGDPYV